MVVVDTPTVVEVPAVVVEKEVVVKPEKYDEETAKLFEQLRREKSKLLKELEAADKEKRKEAIDKLAGFSFDEQVREALEEILLADNDPELRKLAAKSLGEVKNEEALPALEKARVEDPSEEVRREADKAIKKIKEY